MEDVRRGEIYFASLGSGIGSEQAGTRPVLIIQNNDGNRCSPTTIVAPLSSKIRKRKLPTHVHLCKVENKLRDDSVVMFEQMRIIDKSRLGQRLTRVSKEKLIEVDNAIVLSAGIEQRILAIEYFKGLINDIKNSGNRGNVCKESLEILDFFGISDMLSAA